MKLRLLLCVAVVAGIFFAIGRSTADTKSALNQKTLDNLSTAMHGEAFAYAKYMLYAHHARQNGNKELGDLFEKAARTERFEHFAEEAALAGLVGSDAENLKDAVKGESYEAESMYLNFSKEAAQVGDKAASQRFEEIRRDEMKHRDSFKAALAGLGASAVEGR
jgi:rubrerythrin